MLDGQSQITTYVLLAVPLADAGAGCRSLDRLAVRARAACIAGDTCTVEDRVVVPGIACVCMSERIYQRQRKIVVERERRRGIWPERRGQGSDRQVGR